MSATIDIKRICTITESVQQSCLEVKLMREGKIPKRSWEEFRQRMKNELPAKKYCL